MEQSDVERYLTRLGIDAGGSGADPATPELLRALHEAHLRAVPFENLSIHLGEPVSLDPATLIDKIVGRGRGGFCYELNGAFGMLLAALGFPVTHLAARVAGEGGLGPPFDHLALLVDAGAQRWLADVGFGAHSRYPLQMDTAADQADPNGVFRLVDTDQRDVDVLADGVVQYRLELRARVLADFEAMCWYHQTSPRSFFTRQVTCSRQTDDGRVTLSGDRLIRTTGDHREEVVLTDDESLLDAYRDLFGLRLDRVPVAGTG